MKLIKTAISIRVLKCNLRDQLLRQTPEPVWDDIWNNVGGHLLDRGSEALRDRIEVAIIDNIQSFVVLHL